MVFFCFPFILFKIFLGKW